MMTSLPSFFLPHPSPFFDPICPPPLFYLSPFIFLHFLRVRIKNIKLIRSTKKHLMGLKCILSVFCCLLLILLLVNVNLGAEEVTEESQRQRRSAGGGRVGDLCSQNTDCQSGMFCQLGQCQCLSNYVAIASFCWPKVNPGDSGCVEDTQCEGVWPGAKCTRAGICECPEHYVPAKTRDGTVCITSGVPPACPLPEPNNPEAPSPSTLLANPSTHPLAPDSYMPILCTSQSTEVTNSNGGDGSSWCIYPDGDKDIYIADLYNCIPHPQIRPEYFPEYSPTVDGICCPSRAFVCIQLMSQGDEPSIPRWWYNSITGTCSQFLWDPTQSEGVSPNNFRTLEHCESYCRHTCRRGSAQFQRHLRATILDELPIANCAHQSGVCAPENGCVQMGSSQQCCPTIASICSPSGGRISIPLFGSSLFITKDAFDPGAQIAGTNALTRFYYDSEQGRCLNFLYEGGLGNFNNFGTKQDCENFCSKLVCEFGQPLRVAEGQWQRCESSSDCPSAYQCDSGHKVCCPTAQTICTQPKRVGECTGSVSRYWYNAATRQCELFDYTGCQGNDNNFEQLMECQMKCRNIALEPKCAQGRAHRDLGGHFTRCAPQSPTDGCPPNHECHFDGAIWGCCPNRGWTCSLGPDRGIQCGAGRSVRFQFDADKQSCESFQYEGCDGNANNFQSLEQCQEYCGAGGCPNGGQPLRDSTNNQFLTCSAQQPCPSAAGSGNLDDESHECVLVNLHGTFAHRCCPTKLHICSLPPQPGLACQKRQLTRWYFNIVTKECGKFGFNGCNGNLNNFENQEQCQNFCSSSACAPGELVYRREQDPRNDDGNVQSGIRSFQPSISHRRIVQCESTLSVPVCPRDFRCVRDQLAHRHVCCGAPPSDVCPPGEKPFWNALDESVRECQANVAGSCPADFLCRLSAAHSKYFCCAPRNGTLCPDGRSLYRQPKTLQPLRCVIQNAAIASSISFIQQQNLCPDGFSCQSRLSRDIQGHCCSAQPICKSGASFFVDERSQQPRRCIPGSFAACPDGFHCERRQQNGRIGGGNGQGVCCKGPPIEGNGGQSWAEEKSDGCPPQESALFLHKQIVQCDPFNPKDKGCPRNYTCQYAKIHQHYQCCAKREILNGTIIGGEVANKRVEENGAEKETEQNEEDENLGCPIGQVAALDFHSLARPHSPRPCTVSAPNNCPLGFSCQFSERNSQFQCCAHRAGCPRPSVAFVDSAGQPQSCSIGKTTTRPLQCPPGFGCQKTTASSNEICCTLEGEKGTNIRGGGTFEIKLTTSTEDPILVGQPRERQKPKEKHGRKKCKPNEQWTNGHCRARRLGDACIVAEHCPPSMDCVEYACECLPGYRPKNEWKCELAVEENKSRHKGRRKGENEEEEDEGNMHEKCEHGEVAVDGECLRGHLAIGARCHLSAQCSWNGAHCVSGRCKCTGGMVAHRNKCHRDVCGGDHYRLPQLGRMSEAITCGDHQNRKCIWPNRCTFSRSLHSYICCHSASNRIGQSAKMVVGLVTMTPAAKAKNGRKAVGSKRRQQFGRLKRLIQSGQLVANAIYYNSSARTEPIDNFVINKEAIPVVWTVPGLSSSQAPMHPSIVPPRNAFAPPIFNANADCVAESDHCVWPFADCLPFPLGEFMLNQPLMLMI